MASESAIKNCIKQLKGQRSGNIPYYTMPISQAKVLEREGLIKRTLFGSIEVTEQGLPILDDN